MTGSYSAGPDYDSDSEPSEWPPLDNEGQAAAVADYLADMIAQLEDIARRSQLDLLVYLLSMAKSEAQAHVRIDAPPASKSA